MWIPPLCPKRLILVIFLPRFIYLPEGTSGYATSEDELVFPLAPYNMDEPGMTLGRCRRSATFRFSNKAPGYENMSYFLTDGHDPNGFARLKLHYNELLEGEVLGSAQWCERTYGIGPHAYDSSLEWALEFCRSVTQAGQLFEGSSISKTVIDQGDLTVVEMLESEDWLFSGFGSLTKTELVELLQLLG
jgi:hypothetical protein